MPFDERTFTARFFGSGRSKQPYDAYKATCGGFQALLELHTHLGDAGLAHMLGTLSPEEVKFSLQQLHKTHLEALAGTRYQAYGAGPCSLCRQPHAVPLHVKESSASRFKLMQFAAELMSHTSAVPPPNIAVTGENRFMLGLLISGRNVLVSASGDNSRRGNKVQAKLVPIAKLKGYTLCPPIDRTVAQTSRVGRTISVAEYAGAQAAGAAPPGLCAAPKLIHYACSVPALKENWANWEMSEVFYLPDTKKRTPKPGKNAPRWTHGLSAPHCATCNNLIPLLMCPRQS